MTAERNAGIDVVTLLGLLFVGLKLANVIHWSWVWVLLPFWGPLVIVVMVLAFLLMVRK